MIGEVIDGTYRVVERLGAGAMGEVYLVEHVTLGRREAIKVLLPELASNLELAARFRREARAINRLRHPNIVGIYDFGQLADGRLYLAMELVSGDELDKILDRAPGRRIGLRRALALAHQLATAIDHAHSHGVVHRDLKPNNLMVVAEGGRPDVLKILDFGVAKVLDAEGKVAAGDELTRRGEVLGTPEYLAPERLGGGPDDPRSDLYSIGCILHELIAGAPPFAGQLAFVLASHMSIAPPSLTSRVIGVPKELEEINQRLLCKHPDGRYQNAGDLARAIERVPGFDARAGVAQAVLASEERTVMAMQAPATPTARDLRDQLCETLVALAEGQPPGDPMLAQALQYVRQVRDERARILAARAELDAHHAQTLQASRETEGSLRFAIADLRFDRARATGRLQQDVDYQIYALSSRVQEVSSSTQQALRALEEHGLALGAYERDLEPRWTGAHKYLRTVLGGRAAAIAATLDRLL